MRCSVSNARCGSQPLERPPSGAGYLLVAPDCRTLPVYYYDFLLSPRMEQIQSRKSLQMNSLLQSHLDGIFCEGFQTKPLISSNRGRGDADESREDRWVRGRGCRLTVW